MAACAFTLFFLEGAEPHEVLVSLSCFCSLGSSCSVDDVDVDVDVDVGDNKADVDMLVADLSVLVSLITTSPIPPQMLCTVHQYVVPMIRGPIRQRTCISSYQQHLIP